MKLSNLPIGSHVMGTIDGMDIEFVKMGDVDGGQVMLRSVKNYTELGIDPTGLEIWSYGPDGSLIRCYASPDDGAQCDTSHDERR